LLEVHSEWLKKQLMPQDPFSSLLHIDRLKSHHAEQPSTHVSPTAEVMETMQPNESSILTLMEVLALGRIEAINLLEQYNGDMEAIFQSLLS
jgi:hypothetical protein